MTGGAQDHAAAILGLLRAGGQLTVYPAANGTVQAGQGTVPAGAAPPYVVAWITVARAGVDDHDGRSTRTVATAICHCVGANPTAARAVADLVAERLLDVTPTVPGRSCWPIRQDESRPPTDDETTGVQVVDQVDVYRLESTPA